MHILRDNAVLNILYNKLSHLPRHQTTFVYSDQRTSIAVITSQHNVTDTQRSTIFHRFAHSSPRRGEWQLRARVLVYLGWRWDDWVQCRREPSLSSASLRTLRLRLMSDRCRCPTTCRSQTGSNTHIHTEISRCHYTRSSTLTTSPQAIFYASTTPIMVAEYTFVRLADSAPMQTL